jgi:ATP-dependent Lon protease
MTCGTTPTSTPCLEPDVSLFDEHPLTEADRKAHEILGEKGVIKSLAQQAAFRQLPRYVSEYLLAKYVKPDAWRADLANVQEKIRELLPDQQHRELLKDRLLAKGEVTLIDHVEARVDLRGGRRWARVPALGDAKVRVSAPIVEQHSGLLLGGLWGTAKVRYAPEIDADAPNELVAFTPFQIGRPNLEDYRSLRRQFAADEWATLMLQSAGYAGAAFPERRTRLLLLARLAPLVERNVNLLELGPRQTGKTFLLRNLSPRVFTVSGGKTTPANLFVNLATKQVGILGTRKVIVFDEIAHTTFGDEEGTVSTLKDFMESGQFSRGNLAFTSDASLVFTGNLDVEGTQPHAKYRHLLEPLPDELIDTALHDRMHAYLPGWEYPKISPASLATGVGFVTDYFGEALAALREESYADLVRRIPMREGMTRRDLTAVERITSALVKLLHPHGEVADDELLELVTFASEMRQRVHHQLVALAPGEFRPRVIGPASLDRHEAPDLQARSADPSLDPLNQEARVGAATGLAVVFNAQGAEIGGTLLRVQCSALRGSPGIDVTGIHGETLKHSVKAVYNLLRDRWREFNLPESRLASQQLAVHLVGIAERRDGPSAGLAFLVAMASALSGRAVKSGFAFSGEVALHGEVGAVGGLAHKLSAALKGGRREVVVPKANAVELAALPAEVRNGLNIHSIEHAREALAIALTSE